MPRANTAACEMHRTISCPEGKQDGLRKATPATTVPATAWERRIRSETQRRVKGTAYQTTRNSTEEWLMKVTACHTANPELNTLACEIEAGAKTEQHEQGNCVTARCVIATAYPEQNPNQTLGRVKGTAHARNSVIKHYGARRETRAKQSGVCEAQHTRVPEVGENTAACERQSAIKCPVNPQESPARNQSDTQRIAQGKTPNSLTTLYSERTRSEHSGM